MRSRTKKWAHYRAAIKATPEARFPKRKDFIEASSSIDQAAIEQSAKAKGAITSDNLKNKRATPYTVYAKRKNGLLVFKLSVTLMVAAGFVCAWFFWVMR